MLADGDGGGELVGDGVAEIVGEGVGEIVRAGGVLRRTRGARFAVEVRRALDAAGARRGRFTILGVGVARGVRFTTALGALLRGSAARAGGGNASMTRSSGTAAWTSTPPRHSCRIAGVP